MEWIRHHGYRNAYHFGDGAEDQFPFRIVRNCRLSLSKRLCKMGKSYRALVWCFSFVAIVAGNLVFPEAQAQSGQLPPGIVEALQKYAKLNSSRWSWEGTLSYTVAGKKAKYSTVGSYIRYEKKFAWTKQLTEGKKSILDQMVRFDGTTLAQSNGKDQLTWYAVEKISANQPHDFSFSVPCFDAIGIHYPKENGSLTKGDIQSKILYLLENGATLVRCVDEKLGDKQVTLIELEASHEALSSDKKNVPEKDQWLYYLSTAEGYGVVKHERRTTSGKRWFESTVSALSKTSDDLPILGSDVSIRSYVKMGEPEFQVMPDPQETTVLKVKNSALGSTTDDDFVIRKESAKAGAMLIDGVTPELQNSDGSISVFAMPASPEDLDKAIAAASVKRPVMPRVAWVLGLTVVVGGSIAAYLRYRKSR
jgi:hypothetical protein